MAPNRIVMHAAAQYDEPFLATPISSDPCRFIEGRDVPMRKNPGWRISLGSRRATAIRPHSPTSGAVAFAQGQDYAALPKRHRDFQRLTGVSFSHALEQTVIIRP